MRKFFTTLIIACAALTANAQQKALQGNGVFDNWSIGLVGGGITPTTHSDFFKDMRATYGVEIGKQISPIVGLAVQFTAANNVSSSANIIDASNLSLLGKFNLSNLFCGYKGQPRLFEIEAVAGAGWGHHYYPGNDDNYMTSKYGLNFNFNLGEAKAWTISLKPSIVYNMESDNHNVAGSRNNDGDNPIYYNVNKSAIELMAGVTYHFKNPGNGKHYMTLVRPYDQGEVDALNAKINDLRAQVNDRDAEVERQKAQINDLEQLLNDCRNRKPAVEVQTVTNNTNSLEQTVTFRQGKSVVDPSQQPNVERVATFMKNHPGSKVSIKGYASPEGSAEINAKLANERAAAVKTILVNKYKISADRISAEGQGVGNMFSEPDWNRVSICTIEEAK